MQMLVDWDTSTSLSINGWHTAYMDNFMELYSGKFIWIPFYISFAYVVFRNYYWKVAAVWCLIAILLLVINDQLCSSVLRHEVGRMRPSNLDNSISAYVHVVDGYRGGRYGFPSAHATNCFGMAFYTMYVLRRRFLTIIMFIWAILMCYSRIYLGLHYLGDVTGGMLLGFVDAAIIYYLFKRFMPDTAKTFKLRGQTSPNFRLPIMVYGLSTVAMLLLAFFVDTA